MMLAFQSPAHFVVRKNCRQLVSTASSRRFRTIRPRACAPSNKNDDTKEAQQRQSSKAGASQWKLSQANKKLIAEAEATFDELDTLAEQWIGADLNRWEWYERMKARRGKMMTESRKTDEEMDEGYENLRQTFMEFDAVFGTKMLDDETRISPVGWSIVVITMLLYVLLGYAVVELVVKLFTEASPGLWY
ncbi:hypothetical protein BWQ96_01525 [Gracilariopsis chorda]|uniref:Uncharacterized protein n=1 Tax=Gracilariopsis chorda TaxID=448386 RepID=A0A2V3J2W2_9FLOR|nr:hypothetical protein BWQ96_01525 [Gracilariopsis chorda]|eukprot:PXF48673.1 hypothetical protein BWQ96_01525 [Gracilariopsis chorda]